MACSGGDACDGQAREAIVLGQSLRRVQELASGRVIDVGPAARSAAPRYGGRRRAHAELATRNRDMKDDVRSRNSSGRSMNG